MSRSALKFAPGELVFGYRLIRELGRGSFGEVWLATNDKGFEWALKIVSLVGSGGKKEFRALQLIKDRKIKSTHLLKLIDYGLLDRDGTSLTPTSAPPAPKTIPVTPPTRGTLIPDQRIHPSARTSIEQVAARDTQHNRHDTVGDDAEDIHSRAMWLIIVMEVGDRTLHELQLDETKRELTQRAARATRAVKRSGQTMLGQKPPAQAAQTAVPPPADPADVLLVPLPIERVLPYIDQAARGLDYLHRQDILHRDVKPQNIMLVDNDAKLCDYGLASEVRNSAATTEGCSPAYAAPEAINNRPVPASDQYSLAVTYVELISGRWPFFGTTQTAIYREKDEGRHNLTFIRNRRSRLVLARALAKNPDDRFPNCTEFAQQLIQAEQSRGGSRLKPVLVMGGMAALAIALAGAGFAYKDDIARLFKRPIVPIVEEPFDQVLDLSPGIQPQARLHGLEVSLLTHSPDNDQLPKGALAVPSVQQAALVRTDRDRLMAATDRQISRTPRAVPFRKAAVLSIRPPAAVPPLPKIVYRNADEELAAVWQASTNAPDDYLKRHIELVSKAQQPAHWWDQLAERAEQQPQWLTAIEPYLMSWLAESGSSIPSQPGFTAFRSKVQDLGVERMISRELKSAADLPKALASPAYVLNEKRPIALALKTEWELRTKAARPAAEESTWLKDRIAELQAADPAAEADAKGHPTWGPFGAYVRSLLYARRGEVGDLQAALAQCNLLLQPEQLPGWLTPQRRDLIAQTVGRVALAELKCTASDVPKFASLKSVTSAELKQLMQRAETHQLTSASLGAVQALASVTESDAPRWNQVYDQVTAALVQAETKQLLAQQDRLLLLEYVAALAQFKSGDSKVPLDSAIDRLAQILQAKQGTSPRYFNFTDPSTAQDEGLLKNLLLPALEDARVAALKPQSTATSANLAALWGAEGRLLQRNPALVAYLSGGSVTEATELAEALRHAHHAFDKARGLDSQSPQSAAYLVGYGTTLVARPGLGGARVPRDTQLIKVVQALANQNNAALSSHPGLLALQGHVQRMEGKLAAANDSYKRALESTSRAADPFFIREACLIGLCYSQVEQAALVPWSEPDFKHAALEPEMPLAGTKSYYLRQALEQAEEAEQSKLSLQREQIYLAKGFVLEQLASQLDCRSKYGEAQQAYKQAQVEAEKANRPIAVCKLNMGRCYVLGVTDLALKLEPSRKAALLEEAIAALTAAIVERVDLSFEEAKRSCDLSAYYWRAVAQLELAKLDDERRRQLEAEAQRDLNRVLDLGKGLVSTEVGDACRLLVWRTRPQNGIHTTTSPLAARQALDTCLKELLTEPNNFTPAAVLDMIEENRLLPAGAQTSMMNWFPQKGRLDEHWNTSNEWKLVGAKIATLASDNGVPNDPYRNRASRLAGSIQGDEPKRRLAQAFGYLKQLPLDVQAHESREKAGGGGAVAGAGGGGGPALGKEASLGILADKFERVYVAIEQSVDPATRQHLASLNKLKVEQLRERFEELDPLTKRIIREHLLREVTFDDRVKVNELVRRANDDLSSAKLNAIAHNLLKPVFLLPIVDPDNAQHALRLEPLKKRLNALEIKLGIREEPKPKEATAPGAGKGPASK